MKILSIETSCDETAISIVQAEGGLTKPHFEVLGNALFSQIKIHAEFGGVVPTLAKREHARNLPPLLVKALTEANMFTKKNNQNVDTQTNTDTQIDEQAEKTWKEMKKVFEKEEGLYDLTRKEFEHIQKPQIDCIAVTMGPGLEPALWVGISFAVALGKLWNVPVVPVNHMEGHIASVFMNATQTDDADNNSTDKEKNSTNFPAVALLISGGHTEIVSITDWGMYTVIGETRDDAVGEAFDKVARLLGLPYPGGPEISRLAHTARTENLPHVAHLPRPMIHSNDLNFSFSGLKTAVLYYIRDFTAEHGDLSKTDKQDIAREFEDAVTEVLLKKTEQAIDEVGARTLIIAGGVISNTKLRNTFITLEHIYSGLRVRVPAKDLATDNAVMIACAGYLQTQLHPELLTQPAQKIIARGNLKLS